MVKDACARSIIIQGLDDKHLDIVEDSTTSREMILALEAVFVRKSSFSKLHLWRKLIKLRFDLNSKLVLAFDSVIRELKELGTNLDESDRVCHLLVSLPDEFSTVITALETVADAKMNFVKNRLLDEELKIVQKRQGDCQERSDEVVFKAAKSGCYSCGGDLFKVQCPRNRRHQERRRFSRGSRQYRNISTQTTSLGVNANKEMSNNNNNLPKIRADPPPWITLSITYGLQRMKITGCFSKRGAPGLKRPPAYLQPVEYDGFEMHDFDVEGYWR
ncbi:unnamed protein product, partial [Nesidiocoris tenuis]